MIKASDTYYKSCKSNKGLALGYLNFLMVFIAIFLSGCDLIKMKGDNSDKEVGRQPAARSNNSYLYKDELLGIVAPGTPSEDSSKIVEAYITSWIRKQLLIQEASRKIDIDEAQV